MIVCVQCNILSAVPHHLPLNANILELFCWTIPAWMKNDIHEHIIMDMLSFCSLKTGYTCCQDV